ncbi:MAG: DsrE family protein [Candidatus Freyarchaeota archaeon]|nr:DsrE family protein [Candidatus Jordarchaeia archaeon]
MVVRFEKIILIITKPPYGLEDCFSGLYVAVACLNSSLRCNVIFIGDGVYAALAQQNTEKLSVPSVEDLIYALLPDAKLYIHKKSLLERGIPESKIIKGIRLVEDEEVAELLLREGEGVITF